MNKSNEQAKSTPHVLQGCLPDMPARASVSRKTRIKTRIKARIKPRVKKPARRLLTIEIAFACPLWRAHPEVSAVVRRAIRTASAAVSIASGEVSVMLAGDSTVRVLNRSWRNKDRSTNVLSFPAHTSDVGASPRLLGDIVIAYETTKREAHAQQKPFMHHLTHLAVHGFLHLVGYDHAGDEETQTMEQIEAFVLARMQVPDPYLERDDTAHD